MRRLLLVMTGWLATTGGAQSADADATKPYEYQIVLRVAQHRLLTGTFHQQIRGELQDGIQAAFGPVAQVDVLDADSTWLDPALLDSHSEVGPAKRHFVDVSFADGQYVVRARQLDGSTGLASPVVREARTADRAFVGRLITRFVDQDFGPVGTVVGYDKATDHAVLAVRGGALSPGAWPQRLPVGSVFSLARVEGSPPRGRPVESAYLITLAEPKDGRVECRFVYRFQDQLADWPSVTYRALRLGTTTGPVRLRVVDRNGLPPAGLQVRVSPGGFRPTDPVRDQGAVRDGTFDTAHGYERIAFAVLSSGAQKAAQVPVPVVDDRVTVVRLTAVTAGGEARQQLELDAGNAQQRLFDIVRRLQEHNARLKDVLKTQQYRAALDDVTAGLDVLDRELALLGPELTRLRRAAGQVQSSAVPVLDQCDILVKRVRERRDNLLRWHADLERAINEEKNQEPVRQNYLALLQRAKAQRDDLEFEEAIKTYEEILKRYGDREEVRKLLDDLNERWKIKSPEQHQARTFAYGPWAQMRSVDDVRDNLPKARAALDACKRVGDRLTPLKLLSGSTPAYELVEKEFERLKTSESDFDRINIQQVQKLSEDLREFIKDVSAYVRPEEKKP